MHYVADIRLPQSNFAVDGGEDARVTKIQFCIIDGCLVRAYSPFQLAFRRFLRIEICARNDSLLKQILITDKISLRDRKLRLVAIQRRFSLADSDLELPRIDHRQQLALFNVLAFFEINLLDGPVYARLYGHRVKSFHRAQAIQKYWYVLVGSCCDSHRNRLRTLALSA